MIDRIKQLLDWQQLSSTQFADRIGIGRPVVSHILSERNKPSLEVVQRIIAAFPDLSLPWLLSGSGEMLASAPLAAATTAPDSLNVPIATPLTVATAQAKGLTATTPPAPARPAEAVIESQPAASQQTAPGVAGPAPFRANRASSTATPGPSAAHFMANPANPQPAGPVAAQPAASFGPTPPPVAARLSVPAPAAANEASPATVAPPVSAAPLASTVSEEAAGLAQIMSESLGDPSKTIRRIVLFYTDGSFADFKPE